ncbi:Membrane carboxypeptidase (penicillin-binding protein) [Micromonospora pattaloongensis]|uniref:Membrane carboxypeptidase (Penicillin-binding protein) n=2 Tax=Micromonospora pattaloongensis TaxID=405436 RepID=A0A1H3STD7_9ACTN|nr:transglycosylase domain-containing protein [Micromonospora pattaloongensis]SDZ41363.1 Membrane carboxypeptidase (penicillin-binding protein) [Micromonospora pattaloongensis]
MKRTRVAIGRLIPLLRAGLIAGVVIAGATFPLAAAGGLTTKATTGPVDPWPAELQTFTPAQTSYVYAADGKTLLAMFYEEHRRYATLDEMSPYIQQAIVASEDSRFYTHKGVDAKGIGRAFVANQQAGGVSQGGSTLTMQYVRMALRDGADTPIEAQRATEQTTVRKVREMRLSTQLETRMSKQQILERYLNSAYFGHNAYGIFAAAEVFFSKHPKDLTITEAATLAGLVKSPSEYDPATSDRKAATERRNYVIDRMVGLSYLQPDAAEHAKQQPIKLKLHTPPSDCVSLPKKLNSWGFFCDYFKNWWTSQPAFGSNALEREDKLRRGGYRVVTSIDPKLQEAAENNVGAQAALGSPFAYGIVLSEAGTGRVKAMAVNRTYSLDQSENPLHSIKELRKKKMKGNYPNTVVPLLGGGDLAGYQAGSTFKMFTMLTALDKGMPLSTYLDSPFRYKSIYDGGEGNICGNRWCPTNASGAMTGRHAMWSGFGKSVNTYFVQLEEKVGAANVVRMAERLGLEWRTHVDKWNALPANANNWGAFTLGTSDVTPLEMSNAYAAIAAEGRYCDPSPVISITNPDGSPAMYRMQDGTTIPIAEPHCRQVFSADVARAATDAARCPTGDSPAAGGCGGWSTADSVRGTVGRPVAGKTGTTDSTRSAWFVGYTPEYAAASFAADPDNPFNAVGDGQSKIPVDAVAGTLKDALKGKPVRQFAPPSARIVGGGE